MFNIFKLANENKNLKKKIAIMQSELDFKNYMISASREINEYLVKKIEMYSAK